MTQETQQFDTFIAPPLANVVTRGQIGPDVLGSGTASFYVTTGTFYLYLVAGGSAWATYGVNGDSPTPLQPNVWTPIEDASVVSVSWVSNDGILKLSWAQ